MAQKVIVVRAQFLPRSGLLKVVKLVRITRDMHGDGIVTIRGGKACAGRGTRFRLNVIRWKTLTQVKCSDSYVRRVREAHKATLSQYGVIVLDSLFKA